MPLLAPAALALYGLDAHRLPTGVGALGVFAGTGLLMRFFLSGDSSLLTARFA
jgi:hypothetical protein